MHKWVVLTHPVHGSCMSLFGHIGPSTGSKLGAAPSVSAARHAVTIAGSFLSCAERGLCPDQRQGCMQWPLQATQHMALPSEQEWQPGVQTGSSEVVLCNLQKVQPSGTVSNSLIASLEVEYLSSFC